MPYHSNSLDPDDSLDRVELELALEEKLAKLALSPDERERLIREIAERLASGELGDNWDPDDWDSDDGGLAVLVRKLGPRGPQGRSGTIVEPERYSVDGDQPT